MYFKTLLYTAALCLFIVVSSLDVSQARSMDSMSLDGLSSSGGIMAGGKAKRRLFDTSCKGIYDRDFFAQLDRVCQDCYNLYRKPHVATECRRDCYNSEVFESCLTDLMMHDFINEYKEMARMVAGKK